MVLYWLFVFQIIIFVQFCIPITNACLRLTEKDHPVLFCHHSVPYLPLSSDQIPNKIAKLRILGTSSPDQHNGILTRYNLTGLETLIYLEIGNFGLKEIESHTFSAMEHLRTLDLSKNQITFIRPSAFVGPSLSLLSLTDNKGLTFHRLSFRGARVFHLAARNCDLSSLDFDTVSEARPKQLSLSDNKITWLDPRFSELITDDKGESYSNSAGNHVLGYLDLSSNPLNCNCQLLWLSRLIETQLQDANQYLNFKLVDGRKGIGLPNATSVGESSIRLMHQMNMTCADPPELVGRRLPRSWDYFCPTPVVTGIEINLLNSETDLAQITCIGKGRPAPILAWTYTFHGQKVQQILDPTIKHSISNEQNVFGVTHKIDDNGRLYERRLSMNVSLQSAVSKNFTCTAWNNDHQILPNIDSSEINYKPSNNALDEIKTKSLVVPSMLYGHSTPYYRFHEVVVKLTGPTKSKQIKSNPIDENNQITDNDSDKVASASTKSVSKQVTETTLVRIQHDEMYGYLFVKRFTLLELLGAIVGTFITTLALLYLVTNCLSWFCHTNPLFVKHIRKSNFKSGNRWFAWAKDNNALLLRSNNPSAASSASHAPAQASNGISGSSMENHSNNIKNGNNKFLKRLDVDNPSKFTELTTPILSQFGASTINTRQSNIPQALLLTGVTNQTNECGTTPPPNPVYWPQPEYTYSGAGSHEYDVPRPIDSLIADRTSFRNSQTDSQTISASTAHSIFNLAAQTFFPINGTQIYRTDNNEFIATPNIFHTSASVPPFSIQWSQNQANPSTSLTNPILGWTQNLPSVCTVNGQLQNGVYNSEHPNPSVLYSSDYPTYLQTRPYPHHQVQTNGNNNLAINFMKENELHKLASTSTNPVLNTPLLQTSNKCLSE